MNSHTYIESKTDNTESKNCDHTYKQVETKKRNEVYSMWKRSCESVSLENGNSVSLGKYGKISVKYDNKKFEMAPDISLNYGYCDIDNCGVKICCLSMSSYFKFGQ